MLATIRKWWQGGNKSNSSLPAVQNSLPDNEQIALSDINKLSELFGLYPSFAGPQVTPKTSMKVAIVFACVRLIAGAISQMPLTVYRLSDDGDRVKQPQHPLHVLFNLQPTPAFTAASYWEYIVACMLLHGDGYAVMLRDRNGDVEEILPLNPLSTHAERHGNRLVYFTQIDGVARGFDQDDILHFAGFGFNGIKSMSVIQWGAHNSIGLEIAMEQHAGEMFKNGTQQKVAVIKQGTWGEDKKSEFRTAWVKAYGGVANSSVPLVLDNSTDIKTLSINAKDSQVLESREFQITEIARAFGLPSFMVNQEQKSTSWGSGISEIGLSFVRYTLGPHLARFEQEVNRKLFLGKSSFVEYNTSNLMRLTLKERNEAYRQAVGGSHGPGWIARNEIRRMENLPKLNNPKYDELYDPNDANQQLEQQPTPATSE